MIVGLGLDVTELERIAKVYAAHGDRFLDKLLTDAEKLLVPRLAVPFLAARFAAKEATVKALGTGFRGGITFKDIDVYADRLGKPLLKLTGKAGERAMEMGVTHAHVSLTHGRDVAAAVVVLEAP